jgi:hypothetical protein
MIGSRLLFTVVFLCGCSALGPRPVLSAPGECGRVARERLDDALMADLAEGHEREIFERTYEDCLRAAKASQM